ncbi:hypothetical protein [Aquipuribacter nitratireducens]|uniref:Uncharacterized protein n=1 Tax=Aquipuribacter nitratireducens TaxID=650104 RepID=A0ABW0GNK7_9MICO
MLTARATIDLARLLGTDPGVPLGPGDADECLVRLLHLVLGARGAAGHRDGAVGVLPRYGPGGSDSPGVVEDPSGLSLDGLRRAVASSRPGSAPVTVVVAGPRPDGPEADPLAVPAGAALTVALGSPVRRPVVARDPDGAEVLSIRTHSEVSVTYVVPATSGDEVASLLHEVHRRLEAAS